MGDKGSLVFVLALPSPEKEKKVFACVEGRRKKLRAPLSLSANTLASENKKTAAKTFPKEEKKIFFLFFFQNRTFAGNGRVLSRDEMGPIEIIAHFGAERRFHLRIAAEEKF